MSYTDLRKENIAPLNATKLGVYNASGTKVGKLSLSDAMRPTLGNKLYSFGAISDLHLQTSTAESDLRNALTYFNNNESVAFVCISGDIADGGTEVQLNAFKTIVQEKSPNTRVYATNGNHEWYNSKFNDELWEKYVDNPRDYMFTYQNDVFVFLGIQTSGNAASAYTESQQTWFNNIVKTYKTSRIFVFTHCFINGTDNGNYNNVYSVNILTKTNKYGKWLLDIMKANKNICLFTGHSHLKFETQSYTPKINICHEVDNVETGWLIHLPSLTCPRYITNNGTGISDKIAGEAQGVVIDVYDKGLVYRGRDFVQNKFIPVGQFFLPVQEGIKPANLGCTSINLTNSNLEFTSYTGIQIEYTIAPTNCTDMVEFEVDDSAVASVSNTGFITPRKNGSCIVTIKCGTKTATCNITVNIATVSVSEVPMSWIDKYEISKYGSLPVLNNASYCASEYIPYSSASTFKIDFNVTREELTTQFKGSNSAVNADVFYYDSNRKFIKHSRTILNNYIVCSQTTSSQTMNIPVVNTEIPKVDTASYIRLRVFIAPASQVNYNYMHEKLKINTDYQPALSSNLCTSLTLDQSVMTINNSSPKTINAIVTPTDTCNCVYWTQSNLSAGSISWAEGGKSCTFTPLDSGTTILTAHCGTYTATCTITVAINDGGVNVPIEFTKGVKLSKTDNTIGTDNNYGATDYILVENNKSYKLKLSGSCPYTNVSISVVHYDTDKNWVGYSADIVKIQGATTKVLQATVPTIANTKYIRLRMYGGGNVDSAKSYVSLDSYDA